ncbi:MAG: sulfurtransferase complex subunit TusB [Pseudomonadota bacterium]
MAILHIHNKSPGTSTSLNTCLRLAKRDSGILLIEDAVYAALAGNKTAPNIAGRMSELSFYLLINDATARGLIDNKLMPEFSRIDYHGFVQICTEYDRTVSWL